MTEQNDSTGKCPFSGANTSMSDRSNKDWWPNQLNLKILHQNPPRPIRWVGNLIMPRNSRASISPR